MVNVNRTFSSKCSGLSSWFDSLCGQRRLQLSRRLQVTQHRTCSRAIHHRLLRLKCVHSLQSFSSLSFHAFTISVSHRENIAPATGSFRSPQLSMPGRRPTAFKQTKLKEVLRVGVENATHSPIGETFLQPGIIYTTV